MGIEDETVHQSSSGWSPIYPEENLAVMSIGFLLENADDPVIWRGPKKNGEHASQFVCTSPLSAVGFAGMIKQFLRDVDWGDIDYMLIDTPPGTSDEHLSIVQYLKDCGIDGAIIVSTPQEVSLRDVRKEISFCRKVGVEIIGLLENMSSFICPKCNVCSIVPTLSPLITYQQIPSTIFPTTTGGVKALAQEMDLRFLGSIPLDPRIGKSCDFGEPFVQTHPDSPAAKSYLSVTEGRLSFEVLLRCGVTHYLQALYVTLEREARRINPSIWMCISLSI